MLIKEKKWDCLQKKRKVSQKDGKEDKRRGSERKILNHKNRKIIVKSNKSIKNRKCAAWPVKWKKSKKNSPEKEKN